MTDIKFPMIQTTKKTGNESLINFKGETKVQYWIFGNGHILIYSTMHSAEF